MKLFSTNNKSNIVDLKEAVLHAYPEDKGLYMPAEINPLSEEFIKNIEQYHFTEIAYIMAQSLIGDYIPGKDLYRIVSQSINFPAPVHFLNQAISTLELFHGPSMAFKDYGARFMAELMSYFLKDENRPTTILVATSGDTGGAVASGFFNVDGIEVIILYPKGKVSPLQEKQLTTWGNNIQAIEVNGVFDDCQRLVKRAFLDGDLKSKFSFSSANSINIARLIPQSFYYAEAYKQIKSQAKKIAFAVPSGNFGNLTAGLLAHKLGIPIHHFIAATNINDTVPQYLQTGIYEPKASVPTISNAMDVGDPSNFVRMQSLFEGSSTWNNLKEVITGFTFDDGLTSNAIKTISKEYNYIADPHGAVGYLGAKAYLSNHPDTHICFLETAHPGKFSDVVETALNKKLALPEKLNVFLSKEKKSIPSNKDFESFKSLLLEM